MCTQAGTKQTKNGVENRMSMRLYDGSKAKSEVPTPYAVDYNDCGTVFMTADCYDVQMKHPDSLWKCPNCASWNDANFEAMMENI